MFRGHRLDVLGYSAAGSDEINELSLRADGVIE
jgi:hypothetical protein